MTTSKIRPRAALSAMKNLSRNPDDTAQVFRLIDSLSGNVRERIMRRFVATELGKQVLREQRNLGRFLSDREALAALPDGSLGRLYLHYVEYDQLSAEGISGVSEQGRMNEGLTEDEVLVADRLRDEHDLWHATLGYGPDILGECAMMAFTFAQVWNPGPGIIALAGWFRHGRKVAGGRHLIWDAYRRGRRSTWFAAQDWEGLLSQPIGEVRRQLGAGDAPPYIPLWSSGAIRIHPERAHTSQVPQVQM